MGILNYTTSVDAHKTAAEVGLALAKHGATTVASFYEKGQPAGIGFGIMTEFGHREFKLPANVDGVYEAMGRDQSVPPRYKTREQAHRVAWRILKDWTEAQVALIEAGMSRLDEVLLPFMLTDTGRTVSVEYRESAGLRKAIGTGPAS